MDIEKKACMLLKSLIFHYHGLDDEEEQMLKEAAQKLDAYDELIWSNNFIAEDYLSAFERSRDFLKKIIGNMPLDKKLDQLYSVWEDNNVKGYLTEMETSAMLKLAKDWNINEELMQRVKQN